MNICICMHICMYVYVYAYMSSVYMYMYMHMFSCSFNLNIESLKKLSCRIYWSAGFMIDFVTLNRRDFYLKIEESSSGIKKKMHWENKLLNSRRGVRVPWRGGLEYLREIERLAQVASEECGTGVWGTWDRGMWEYINIHSDNSNEDIR